MENTKNYIPIALLSLFIGKLLLFGCNAPEMGIVIALAGIVTVKEYLDRSKKLEDIEASFKKEIEDIKKVVNLQNDVITKAATEVAQVKTHMDGFKLAQGMRKVI